MSQANNPPWASNLQKLTNAQLINILKQNGLCHTVKTKAEYLQRLESHGLGNLQLPDAEREVLQGGINGSRAAGNNRLSKASIPVVTRSKAQGNWKRSSNDAKVSTIDELETFRKIVLGIDYRQEIKELVTKFKSLVDQARKQYPNEDKECLVFALIADGLAAEMMRHTNEALRAKKKEILDAAAYMETIGCMLQMNLMAVSSRVSWSMLHANAEPSMTSNQFHDYVHNLRVVSVDGLHKENPDGTFWDPVLLFEQFHPAFAKVNEGLSKLAASNVLCIDDDHIPHVGVDAALRVVSSRMDKRKGMGIPINTATSVVTGVVQAVCLEGVAKSSPLELKERLILRPGATVTFDRGYSNLSMASFLESHDIGMLGILAEGSRSDHPADLTTVSSSEGINISLLEARDLSVVSFPGVGLQSTRFIDDSGAVACSVMNRTSKSDSGHLRFVGSGRLMSSKVVDAFVRVPKPVSPGVKAAILHECFQKGDDQVAIKLFVHIRASSVVLTLLQGTADWFICRRTGLTASVSSSLIKPVLKFLRRQVDGAFPEVFAALWKDQGEAERDVPEPTTGPLPPSPSPAAVSTLVDLIEPDGTGAADSNNESEPPVTDSFFSDIPLEGVVDDVEEQSEDLPDESVEVTEVPNSADMEVATSTSVEPPVAPESPEIKLQREMSDRLIKQNFIQKHKEQEAELGGKLTEPRVVNYLQKNMSFIVSRKVYSLGLVGSTKVPYVYASPDGLLMINLREIANVSRIVDSFSPEDKARFDAPGPMEVPCGLETKTSKDFKSNRAQASQVTVVVAGSAEYHEARELKAMFKLQLLQQAAVMGLAWVMLCAWTRKGPARTVLIYYPRTLRDEYLALAAHKLVACHFTWFRDAASDPKRSDVAIVARIPSFVSPFSRMVLATHIPLLRAVFTRMMQASDIGPFEPTHTFRAGIIAAYDMTKGATDVECDAFAEATKATPFRFGGAVKISIRLLYSIITAVLKASSIVQFVEESGGVDKLPATLARFQHDVRAKSPINDRLWAFAMKLRKCRIPIGYFHLSRHSLPPRTPAAKVFKKEDVLAVYNGNMLRYLEDRAEAEHRKLTDADFIGDTRLPLHPFYLSKSTPGETIFRPSHVIKAQSLVEAFEKIPSLQAFRKTKLAFWCSEEGMRLRLNRVIAHIPARYPAPIRPALCFWCTLRPREGWTACLFCGENFCCTEHFNAFHEDDASLEEHMKQELAKEELQLVGDEPKFEWHSPPLKIEAQKKGKGKKSGDRSDSPIQTGKGKKSRDRSDSPVRMINFNETHAAESNTAGSPGAVSSEEKLSTMLASSTNSSSASSAGGVTRTREDTVHRKRRRETREADHDS